MKLIKCELDSPLYQDNIKGYSNAGGSRFCEWRDDSSESTIVIARPENGDIKYISKYKMRITKICKYCFNHAWILLSF